MPAVLADVPVVFARAHDEPHLCTLRALDQPAPQYRGPALATSPAATFIRKNSRPEFL
jgi:hypothetical protein